MMSNQDKRYVRMTLLHFCVDKGHTEKVRKLLQEGNDPNIPNSEGATPLTTCCSKENMNNEIYNMLIEAGADTSKICEL